LPIGFGASKTTDCVKCGKTQSFPATLKIGRVVCGTCLQSLTDDDDDDDDDDDAADDNDEEEEEEEEAEQQNSSQFEAAVYAVTTCVFQCRQLSRE
jgi:cobalamin biosynthesis protein CobT